MALTNASNSFSGDVLVQGGTLSASSLATLGAGTTPLQLPGGTLNITVGGAVAMNAAKVVLKVGGSSVSLSAGSVVLKSSTIKLTATGPQPELAAMVKDK